MSISKAITKDLLGVTHDYQGLRLTKKEWKYIKSKTAQWEDRDSIECEINSALIELGYVYHKASFTWTKFQVNASEFIAWYYSDLDKNDLRTEMYTMIKSLKETGKFKVSVESVFESAGYIPFNICVGVHEDFNPEDFMHLSLEDEDSEEFRPENCFLFNNIK